MPNHTTSICHGPQSCHVRSRLSQMSSPPAVVKKRPPPRIVLQNDICIPELCQMWLAYSTPHLKESTFVKYSNTIKNHITPHLYNNTARTWTHTELVQYVHTLSISGRLDGNGGLSEKTIRDTINLLASAYKYAVQMNLIATAPSFERLVLHKKRKPVEILHQNEYQKLEKYLLDDLDLSKCGVLLVLYTGLRIGELCALRWADIDLETGTLQVKATLQRIQDVRHAGSSKTNIVLLQPKSAAAYRIIPLPDFLVDHLYHLEPPEPGAYFLTGTTERFVEPRTMEYRFKRYLRECGLRDTHFHVLRHTFATRCVEVGFDTKSLSEILGHSSVSTTMALYVHPTLEHKRANMNRLANTER